MTKLKDHYGRVYSPIEEFQLGARDDFTVEELKHALSSNYDTDEEDEDGYPVKNGQQVDYLYPARTDIDDEGYSLTESAGWSHMPERMKYLGYEDRGKDPIGYRLVNPEDFGYEGGTLVGFGTFKNVTSGNLGDGHDAWSLFEHVESGRLFLNTGWYSSHDSGEMDEWEEVEPVEQRVYRYKPLGESDSKVFENPVIDIKE